jgi:type II secretory ATPase GspE/PulE/Tfp pilus assembly ATPase PilB-like protein
MRVDGLLTDEHALPPHVHAEVIARIKILANLRTDEHNAPQDGRFRHTFANSAWVDVRVSVMPTYHGENAVLRLLSAANESYTLARLGFGNDAIAHISAALSKKGGLILATGPTGSGKTTTLYTLIEMLKAPERNIVTIEDPIEYALSGTRQIQVNTRVGLTFAAGLRALLRQDPDMIMVGEIRDRETATVAVNTALTGHVVLSTLHTTDAVTAIPRLIDMGIEPYLLSSTLELVIAQRLVRRTSDAGYTGRVAITEVLPMSDTMRGAIRERAPADVLRTLAREHGMRTLAEDGAEKVSAGITTAEEVLRVAYE